MKKTILITVGILVLGGLAFTTTGGLSWLDALGLRGEESLVRSRLEGYWQARSDGDLERVADYIHPLQSVISDPGMLSTEKFVLNELTIEGDTATAMLTVESRIKHPVLSRVTRTLDVKNDWVRYEGQWYLEPKPVGYLEWMQYHNGEWVSPLEQAQQ